MANFELKAAIIRRYGSQIVAARELGISTTHLSHLVQGHDVPRPGEEEILRQKLGFKFKKRPRAKVSAAQDIAENQPEN